MKKLSTFLAFLVLKYMYAEGVLATRDMPEVRLPASLRGSSGLESLTLERNNIKSQDLNEFLKPIRALKSFPYSLDAHLPSQEHDWHNLVDALLARAGNSLEELNLKLPYFEFRHTAIQM